MSQIRTNFKQLISAATFGNEHMQTPTRLLEEIQDDAYDSNGDIPELSQIWIQNMHQELKDVNHLQHDDAIAVLQYIQDQYLPPGTEFDRHPNEEETDRRCETVGKVLVGHGPPFLTVLAFSRRACPDPDTFFSVSVQEEWPFQVTIKVIRLLGQAEQVHLTLLFFRTTLEIKRINLTDRSRCSRSNTTILNTILQAILCLAS